jgi:hypothetical protein
MRATVMYKAGDLQVVGGARRVLMPAREPTHETLDAGRRGLDAP